jgi:hypothetical protein
MSSISNEFKGNLMFQKTMALHLQDRKAKKGKAIPVRGLEGP